MDWWAKIWEFFYPAQKTCPFCHEKRESQELVCKKCGEILKNWREQKFCHPGKSGVFYNKLWAAAPYEGNFKRAVYRLKYGGQTYLAPILGYFMAEILKEELADTHAILVPIPLGPGKLAQRGFNQAVLLARAVSSATGFPVKEKGLGKARDTVPQAGLKKEAREKNLAGTFWADKEGGWQGKTIVLVDDIFTTGATLNEGAKTLLAVGAKEIYGLVWARAVGKSGDKMLQNFNEL